MNTWSHPSQHICPPEISSLTTFAFSSKNTRREGEVFTFSNIYLCIQYQVQKCKYPESIIKSIRNYRESNTNCNKVNMLVLFSYHTCKSARQSHTTKVPPFVLFIHLIILSYTKLITISTANRFCFYVVCVGKTLKHRSTLLYIVIKD